MKKIVLTLLLGVSTIIISQESLKISVSSLDITYNPYYTYTSSEAQYLTGLYEGLVSYHPQDLSPQPALAESWSLSEDKKTYTFTLRDNIKFSNGDPITSETFRNSYIRLLTPETRAEFSSLFDIIEGAVEFRTGETDSPESVAIETPDPKTLKITLKKRAPYFTKILCHHSFTPVHPSLLDKGLWKYDDVISSGPYIIKNREADRVILEKNNLYWDRENVSYKKIELITHRDHQEATREYNQGKLDWMMYNRDLNSLLDMDSLVVNPIFGTTYYYFNPNYKEYSDPEIRKAISSFIPWNKIRENEYIPAHSLIPTLDKFPKNRQKNDIDKSQALEILEKKGFRNGDGLPDILVSIPENSIKDSDIASIIKESIESNTNIKVEIKMTPYPDFFTINRKEEFTISTLSWIGDFADPLTFLEMWTRNSNLNDSGYNNPEYDNIIDGSSTLEKVERYRELSKAEKILLDNMIVIPINHSPGINIINLEYIEEWYPNSLDIHPFKYLRPVKQVYIPGLI